MSDCEASTPPGTIAGIVAFVLLIASLAGFWRVLIANAEMRLTGETLSNYARNHPPKPWHGFEIAILNVSVDGEVHIKAHVSGNLIHTPVEISGTPEYDANARAIFLHVSKTELPRDVARPMLSRLNGNRGKSPGNGLGQELTAELIC